MCLTLRHQSAIKRCFQRLAIPLLGCTLGLLLSEVAFRLFSSPPQTVEIQSGAVSVESDPALGLYQKNAEVFQLRPNLDALIRNHVHSGRDIRLFTNALGFRGPQLGAKLKKRVLFLGDSITLADSVSEEETFVRITERDLARRGIDAELINAAQGATGLSNHSAVLRRSWSEVRPDLVVLNFYLNDFQNSPRRKVFSYPWPFDRSWLLAYLSEALADTWDLHRGGPESEGIDAETLSRWRAEIDRDFAPRLEAPSANSERFKEYLKLIAFDAGGAWTAEAWTRIEASVREIAEYVRKHGGELAIVVYPIRVQVETGVLYNYPQRRMQELAGALSIPVLDLLPIFRAAQGELNGELFFDQCHLTVVGHELVAKSMTNMMEKLIARTSGLR